MWDIEWAEIVNEERTQELPAVLTYYIVPRNLLTILFNFQPTGSDKVLSYYCDTRQQ